MSADAFRGACRLVRETWRTVRAPCAVVRGTGTVPRGAGLIGGFMVLYCFCFWIQTKSGERIFWRNLSRQMAVRMHNETSKQNNAERWGWYEQTPL
jgi:hypothetical protein